MEDSGEHERPSSKAIDRFKGIFRRRAVADGNSECSGGDCDGTAPDFLAGGACDSIDSKVQSPKRRIGRTIKIAGPEGRFLWSRDVARRVTLLHQEQVKRGQQLLRRGPHVLHHQSIRSPTTFSSLTITHSMLKNKSCAAPRPVCGPHGPDRTGPDRQLTTFDIGNNPKRKHFGEVASIGNYCSEGEE
ncbi:hypothetical protein HZH66_002479 [Vespula vulgaris]|uniref:Uncharacterized protein n=1 Tax=Vespula vulgaris TaxID=7454 RepID=A0A834NG01_VESVU|nr:hypothetical protein HZH66_002479 [Vespula vulgaris]